MLYNNIIVMQDRIEDIYRQRAMMGLGEGGCMGRYITPMMAVGYGDGDGYDDMYGGARRRGKRPLSAYNKFVKAFLNNTSNKRKYRTQKSLFKAAAAAWRASGRSSTVRRGRKKKCPTGSRKSTKKGSRGKCVKRRYGRGEGMEFDGNLGMGVLVGGARKSYYNPQEDQLRNLGLTKEEFLKLLSVEDPRKRRPPLFNPARLRRVGRRYAKKNVDNRCMDQEDDGPYLINKDYQCVPWAAPPISLSALGDQQLAQLRELLLQTEKKKG
jgi:hypothetical protein